MQPNPKPILPYVIRLGPQAKTFRGPFETLEEARTDYVHHWREFRGLGASIVIADPEFPDDIAHAASEEDAYSILEWYTRDVADDDMVLAESADGWSLHGPGSADADIADGTAVYLACGTGDPDYDEARVELMIRRLDR